MQSNVINLADRLQARREAVPTWSGLAHSTEIEIMTRDVGKSLLEIIISSEEVHNYAIGNIGSMDAESYRLMSVANTKISEAVGLLMQAQCSLDQAAKNETRGGDNFVDFELPDFHDFPA